MRVFKAECKAAECVAIGERLHQFDKYGTFAVDLSQPQVYLSCPNLYQFTQIDFKDKASCESHRASGCKVASKSRGV